jgi:xanthine dehydrogenase YagR molybdenum-binding subunit
LVAQDVGKTGEVADGVGVVGAGVGLPDAEGAFVEVCAAGQVTEVAHDVCEREGFAMDRARARAQEPARRKLAEGRPVEAQVNGASYSFEPGWAASAVDVLRDDMGLTGTKLACGTGVCGACTVLLDGIPVASCVLPAHALQGRSVTTVEGIGAPLHPVQRAFMACDALQCGFCTPGFVVEAVAFYERWRRARGTEEPPRDEIAAALAGHLCRCGAYLGIYQAVKAACAGRFDADGAEPPRVEAREKVTGRAHYTVDVCYEGQLEGLILRSPHPHANVRGLDVSRALSMPGVKAVVELLGGDRRVRYVGQEVAAVAAADRETARAALAAIDVEYEPLRAVLDVGAARATGAPEVWAGARSGAPHVGEGAALPARWHGNVRGPVTLFSHRRRVAARRIDKARKAYDSNLVDATWRTSAQVHTTLEPHACVVWWREERLLVHYSTQAVIENAEAIAARWNLPVEKVRVLAEHVGGGFGAKIGVTMEAVAAIELSRAAGAPVRVVLDRREELTVGGYRPGVEIDLGLLVDDQGRLAALSTKAYADSGVAIGSQVATLHRSAYRGGVKELLDYDVVSNLPPGTPFRGPSGPVAHWAMEQAVDELAHRRMEDAVALRRRWDTDQRREQLYGWASALPAWRDRAPVAAGRERFRRGVGLAMGSWFYYRHLGTRVEVSAGPAGLVASTAVQDIGTGSRSVIARTVAEVFGMAPGDIHVRIGDSRLVPAVTSGGSRTTTSVGPAATDAAEQVRGQLVAFARVHFGLTDARGVPAGVEHPGGLVPWSDVLAVAPELSAIGERGRDVRPWLVPFVLESLARRRMFVRGRGGRLWPVPFSVGHTAVDRPRTTAMHVSEVEVDMLLGKVRVLRVWGALAAGRIVVPQLARSQCYGGVIQGIGFALYEQRQHDPLTGLVLTTSLEDYQIPGIGDVPEIDIRFFEQGFEHVRGAAVGLGELSTLAVAASIGNAVFHASGWRPRALPIRPSDVAAGAGS